MRIGGPVAKWVSAYRDIGRLLDYFMLIRGIQIVQ
jgi:hypothetical protein